MKKILSLLLALACAFSMTACGGNKEGEARVALENYITAYLQFDADAVSEYVDETPKDLDALNFDSFMGSLPEMFSPYENELKGMYDNLIGKFTEKTAYEIVGVEGEGEEYTYTVSVTIPDFDNINIEDVLSESLSEDVITNMVVEALRSGNLTVNSSEDDVIAFVMPKIIEIANEAISDISVDFYEEEQEFVVTLKDGKWLVNAEKSNLLD